MANCTVAKKHQAFADAGFEECKWCKTSLVDLKFGSIPIDEIVDIDPADIELVEDEAPQKGAA